VETKWRNIAPRVGLAFRPMERTVIRAGYGIMFFNGPLNFYAASFIANPGVAAGSTSGFGTTNTFAVLPAVTAATASTSPIPAPNGPVYFTPSNLRTPYVQQY